MKQVLQSLKTGSTEVAEVPCPAPQPGHVLIRSSRTLISVGTERMLVEFGKAGWIEKARQQPDKVRMVLDKIRTDGLLPTIDAVFNKLDQPLPLGYCSVGVVMEAGKGVASLSAGDRVVSNGKHAEVVNVPVNLCSKVPAGVSDDEAAFTVIAAIGLQGVRLVQPTLGEAVAVTGVGLIGLLTVQLLRAHGCRVLAIDFDANRLALAQSFGAEILDLSSGEDPVAAAQRFSRGRGVDAVIITASTKSNEPVHQAAVICRKRGRIVLVGVTGLELSRADFYEKELSFQVSCSYGPGRYDPNYEEKGHDYPIGFVRWTEQRNFEAVLDMLADGRLNVKPLISHRFGIEEAEKAYELVTGPAPSLGILLDYPTVDEKPEPELRRGTVLRAPSTGERGKVRLGFVGAGNYATAVLIPAFKAAGGLLKVVASNGGVSALHAARKFGFEASTTELGKMFSDPEVNAVVISTRHDSHAELACQALRAGKNVFVEKPIALTVDELAQIERTYAEARLAGAGLVFMGGFNRRFSPHAKRMKELLEGSKEPKAVVITVNAGAVPADHWTHDPRIGGGRVLGEACHFIDLLRFLVGTPIIGHSANCLDRAHGDTATLQFRFADGSLGTVHYFANGSKSFPKERIEVFVGGRVLQLNNFRKLIGYGWPQFDKMNLWRQDKGQENCVAAFIRAVETHGESPIAFDQLVEVSRVTIEVGQSLFRA